MKQKLQDSPVILYKDEKDVLKIYFYFIQNIHDMSQLVFIKRIQNFYSDIFIKFTLKKR